MRWRRAGLPAEVREAAASALSEVATEPRVLAWGRDGEHYAVGFPSHLAYQDDSGWQLLAWHRVLRGGWDQETQHLTWVDYDGGRGDIALAEPGSLPELFKERVEASILVSRQVPVEGTKHGVVVVGRRILGAEPPVLEWHASLNKGTSWSDPGARAAAESALATLKSEYDPYAGA
ncbi:hypothetical protein GA0111570_105194 [Raineyella antarctica]|uniref:Uncharacterized protein n=1 Tax=Raineyella antarctica TaxID=1577474 RepID=A0A1G6GXE3_9ACTN|nr:hypothetical protein [Raineyella antarctica]SDB86345.1 hypothetical protein GA0111570_105194 [Raineyella antarctica]